MPRILPDAPRRTFKRAIRAMKAENFSGSVLISPNGAIAIVPDSEPALAQAGEHADVSEIKL